MNRFMKKFKAVYCNASFIFAIAVLMVTISLCIFYPDSVNASQSPSPSGDISTNDVTNDLDDVKSLDSGDKDLADATSDSTNGLNIYYNNESGSLSTPVRMFLVLTVLSLAPSILIMLTSFTRIIIVLHFVRTAIGTQTAPPNQVLVGLALFLTLFIMWLQTALQDLKLRKFSGKTQVMDIHKEIAKLREQTHVLARLKAKGFLDEAKYIEQTTELTAKINKLQTDLKKLTRSDDEDETLNQIEMLIDFFEMRDKPITKFEESAFESIVERIVVINQHELEFHLIGGLKFKEKIK